MKFFVVISFFIQLFETKIITVVEFCRHGARAPMYNNLDSLDWKLGFDQLTEVGQRQHYLIGRQMRKKYIQENLLLSPNYNMSEIEVHSTSTERTILSAQSQLMGLYYHSGQQFSRNFIDLNTDLPPQKIDDWESIIEDLNGSILPNHYQPIPIYVIPDQYNKILTPENQCPIIDKLIALNYQDEQYIQFENQLNNSGFYDEFRRQFNISEDTQLNIEITQQYLDTLNCDNYAKRSIINLIPKELYQKMEFSYAFRQFFINNLGSKQALKLSVTQLFLAIQTQFNNTLNNIGSPKLLIFSAHDDQLNHILTALQITTYSTNFNEFNENRQKFANPPFASTIFFELHETEQKQVYVNTIYNGIKVQIMECDVDCELQKFYDILNQWIQNDWDIKCQIK